MKKNGSLVLNSYVIHKSDYHFGILEQVICVHNIYITIYNKSMWYVIISSSWGPLFTLHFSQKITDQ